MCRTAPTSKPSSPSTLANTFSICWRQLGAIHLERPALRGRQLVRFGLVIDRADEFGRIAKGWIGRIHLDHRQKRREWHLERKQVPEFLFEDVADHAFCLSAEDIERYGSTAE